MITTIMIIRIQNSLGDTFRGHGGSPTESNHQYDFVLCQETLTEADVVLNRVSYDVAWME